MAELGRPPIYTPETRVALRPDGETVLKKFGERRAIVIKLVDFGGVASIKKLSDAFGYDVTEKVQALRSAGWLEVIE